MKKILKSPTPPSPKKKSSLIKQINYNSCGPNVMGWVIFHKYGLKVPEEKLINISNCGRNGAYISGMTKIADKYGLNYELKHNSLISDLIDSIDSGNPVILLIQKTWLNIKVQDWSSIQDFGHYIVVHGYSDKEEKIYYYEPYYGKKRTQISYKNLDERWHGLDLFPRNHFGMFIQD